MEKSVAGLYSRSSRPSDLSDRSELDARFFFGLASRYALHSHYSCEGDQAMRARSLYLWALVSAVSVTDAWATNVAAGKPVTLNGAYGVMTCCWAPPFPLADGSTLTDGLSLPENSIWHTDTVWWDARNAASAFNSIVIDLLGTFSLYGFSIQADNNETYRFEYQDELDVWHTAWDAPDVGGFGMMTRSVDLGAPIVTDMLRVTAIGGDGFYAVSEIQANVPEPGTMLLLGGGLLGLAARRRRS